MGLFNRKYSAVRANLSFQRQQAKKKNALTPAESRRRGNYADPLIKKKFFNYYNIRDRLAVCKYDAIGKKLTYMWAQMATAKTFKFYSSHEVDAVEIMEDIRAKWIELDCNPILRKSIVPFTRDGFSLLDLRAIKKNGEVVNVEYDVYGEYECPPSLWTRDSKNKIILYKVQYTPQPRAFGSFTYNTYDQLSHTSGNLRLVNKPALSPKDIIHVERGEPNMGWGDPLIEACWDAMTKLREESHMEMIDRRLVPEIELSEDDYDANHTKANQLLKMIADSDVDTARLWYKDKNPDGTISDYPKFKLSSPSTSDDRKDTKGVRASDYGNLSSEWARICAVTGHTIHYFMGNRAGAVKGAETDQEDDVIQEIIDFSLCEVIIRKILDWLDKEGIISLPEEQFVIKYWKDWEFIEKKAKWLEMMETTQGTGPTTPDDKKDITTSDIVDSGAGTKDNIHVGVDPGAATHKMTLTGYDENGNFITETLDVPYGKTVTTKNKFGAGPNKIAPAQKTVIRHKSILRSLDTVTKVKNAGKEIGWSMGTKTAENIVKTMSNQKEILHKRVHRIASAKVLNKEAFGNSIKDNYPLYYYEDGVIVEEYICPEAWKENVGVTVPLGVYHDFWGDVVLPDWQIVGDAEVFGWDDDLGEDFVKFNYEYDKIDAVFKEMNYYDWLTPELKENGTADISTAYYCDVVERYNEKLDRVVRYQINIELKSISFVPRGNCPGEVCTIQENKANADELNQFIHNCIAENDGTKQECIQKAYYTYKNKEK